jgi:hypothetical protein
MGHAAIAGGMVRKSGKGYWKRLEGPVPSSEN